MPRDVVELTRQIKAANDIADVIGGYIPVIRAGSRFKCLCPFHDDKHPSLNIDPKFQNYKCWACGAHGDVITFVEKYERVDFLEARAILARRAGINLDNASPQDGHKTQLLAAMKWAQELYQQEYLNGDSAERARRYMGERQLSGATVRQFGVGYAPQDHGWLERHARRDGIAHELLVETGLLGQRDEGAGLWDRFRDRVMFPIRDVQGRTVGFGGRILPDSPLAARSPKYYNTGDTAIFTKSDNVFGIDLARPAAASAGCLALVEGYTDVMMAHQSGIANVVATMGTALNERHLGQLRRYVKRIVLVFDADEGGLTGVDRALELFASHDFELAVAALPTGCDPAELLAEPDGAVAFREALAAAADALDFKLDRLLRSGENTVAGAHRVLDAVLGILALAPAAASQAVQMKRELMLTRLSHRLGLELTTVRGRLKELQQTAARGDRRPATPNAVLPAPEAPAAAERPPTGPVAILERQLIQVLLAEPQLVPLAVERITPDELRHTGLQRLLRELFDLQAELGIADFDGLRIRLLDRPDLVQAAFHLLDVGRGIPDRREYLHKIIDGFARQRTSDRNRSLKQQLLAVGADDEAAVELLRRLNSTAD